jgi:hypothetical protein
MGQYPAYYASELVPRGFQRGAPFGRKIGVETPIAESNGKYKIC